MHLRSLAEQVKFGVYQGGGIPLEFNVIGVCDGIAMNHKGMSYSLVSRETIADSVEIMAQAHGLDGLVLIPNCDKVVPGMVMAAARLDVPVIIVSGGPMLAGNYRGRRVDLKDVFEGVGAYFAGNMSADDLCELEDSACPTCGSCAGLFTANSMSCLTEALGLALPGDATIPAPFSARLASARRTGAQAVEVARQGWGARRFLSPSSLRNALALDAALGCSTNTVLHLKAIANEAGVELPLQAFNDVSAKTPHLVDFSPSGPWFMEDLERAGGVMAVLHRLAESGNIDGSVPTVSGVELATQYANTPPRDEEVIRPLTNPTGRRAASPSCSATWRPKGPWSRNRPSCRRCCSIGARRGSSTGRFRPWRPSRLTISRPAAWWSFATSAPRAARAARVVTPTSAWRAPAWTTG